ncbi:MAG: DUF1127 domain-containing protein [Gammaproteobacteria bacterium]|nr:DUF1127 domain-containing protein [Gammaproteobacteria bacterium]
MNYFQFAIASIVDANTGNGLVHSNSNIDYAAAASHGRAIRSKSIVALLGQVKRRLSNAITSIHDHQAQKRNLRRLAGLNDHILEDIGFSRGDIIALQMGQIDLRQLEARRVKNRRATRLPPAATNRSVGNTIHRSAFNEAVFARAKCA